MLITQIHQEILNFLLNYKRDFDNNLFFTPRKINNKDRLNRGYYFIGNEDYLQISFWNGRDSKEKIHNIAFVVLLNGTCYIEISSRDNEKKASKLKELVNELRTNSLRFELLNNNYKVRFYYPTNNYLYNLKSFIEGDKKVIDKFLSENNTEGITFLDNSFHNKYVVSNILNRGL